ncbi:unnamed protein product [Adineta steineri]|uniref:Uncharacterized protein n=1 Tax=Adineta steineri TaxID=433720 RepID=A0A813V162_9BILA|nr:unnamed protein product [Adineta steineri]CAF0870938.1 unnamed protein product [Adineta steineri]
MTDANDNSPSGTAYLLRRSKSSALLNNSQTKLKRQPTVVLYVDENCPQHGCKGKCSCSTNSINKYGSENNGSFYQNNYGNEQQTYDTDNFVSTTIKPFNNNPPLPVTQKNVVGSNFQFQPSSQSNGWKDFDDEQLGSLMIYRDALKQNLTTPYQAGGGFPKVRLGRAGGFWRHIKQTNTYSGSNLAFVDGTVRVDDTFKYPMPRYGYPPASQQQQQQQPQQLSASSSFQDLSYQPSNPAARSMDSMTWSATAQLNRRPSLSQYSNRYERHAKDGFAFWPTDTEYKKPRCKPMVTGTYKTWLGLSDSILKL